MVKNNKGITLIALVITIIVLLILAGVSIAMLTGENGILSQAQKADVETRGAAVEEAKNLAKKLNGFLANQFENEDNILAHYETTGKEILEQLEGKKMMTAKDFLNGHKIEQLEREQLL